MTLSTRENNKLNICKNFILKNSDHSEYLMNRFAIDSRRINHKQVFISLDTNPAKNVNNIKHAITQGATGFITTVPVTRESINSSIPFLVIKNLENIYTGLFKIDFTETKRKPTIIGITGTNGKTSTVLLLAQALTLQNKKVGVVSSEGVGVYPDLINSDYTTPPIDRNYMYLRKFTDRKCHYVIMECSSQGLHQGRLDGFLFNYSLITNIDQDHIDYHLSLTNYVNSKLKIINQSETSILNHDCVKLNKINLKKYTCNVFFISKKKHQNQKVLNTSLGYNFDSSVNFNTYSLLMITAIMKLENFSEPKIKKSLKKLTPLMGRRQVIDTKNKGTYIIDYAHTSSAYKAIYKEFAISKKICTLFGCGGDRDQTKRAQTGRIVDKYSSKIIITSDNSRTERFQKIQKDILEGIKNTKKVIIIRSRKEAIRYMFKHSSHNQLNFILGKGNENYIFENHKKIHHNDIIYLKKLLRNYEHKTI